MRLGKARVSRLRRRALGLDHAIVSSRRRNARALEAQSRVGFDRGEISPALGGSREINILLAVPAMGFAQRRQSRIASRYSAGERTKPPGTKGLSYSIKSTRQIATAVEKANRPTAIAQRWWI